MRKLTRLLIAALFLQILVGGEPAQAVHAPIKMNSVTASGVDVTVKWSYPDLGKKDSYMVEFSKVSTGKAFRVIKTRSTGIIAKLDPFTKYAVRVRNSAKTNSWTVIRTFTTKSDPVSGLVVTNTLHTTSDLSWNPVAGATSYDIIQDDNLLASVVTTKYTLTNLKPGSKSAVLIRPKSGLIVGTSSPAITVVSLNSAPSKFASSLVTSTGSTLSWEPILGADSYNLYANKKLLINTKLTSYQAVGLLPGTTVAYSVAAVFGGLAAQSSEPIEVTTLIETPATPTLQAVTSNSVTANWKVDPNATSYEVVLFDSTGTNALLTNSVDGSLSSTTFSGLSVQTSYTVGIKNLYGGTSSKQSALATFTTPKPSLTGLAVSNITTTSATLNWYPMPGVLTYEVYRDGILIPAATSALTTASVSYTFTSLAPGNTYKFAVRASYIDGFKTAQFTDFAELTQTLVIDPAFAPVSTSAPVITLPYASVPIVGATLSASTGLWSSVPLVSTYAYQWQRSLDGGSTWANLVGENRSTYKVVASDYAFRLRIRVSATNLNGSTSANSATSSAVAETYNVQIPVVRGTLVSGQLLEVTDGTWSSDYPLTFRYQWNKNGSAISGENSPSYTLVDGDINATITVSVIAYSSLGSVSAESTIRTAVAAAGNTVAPVISGTVRPYSTLTTTDGTWLKSPTITYQWQRSLDGMLWNNIASATNSTYTVTLTDVGFYIRSQVFGSRTVSTTYKYTAPSLATVVVPALIAVSTSAPVISGSWTTGSSLTTTNGVWTSSGSYTYQWQRSADNSTWNPISGATSNTYLLVNADASNYIRVQVYLTGSSGADGVAYSVSTAKVGAPYNTAAPAISGSLRVGVALTVSDGTWSGSPTLTYQWQTSSDGIAWANIGSATNSSYTPTHTIANLRLRAIVSATNATDSVTATSQVVQGFLAPIATAIPVVSGTVQSGQTLTTTEGTWPSTSAGYVYSWHRSSDGGVTWTNIAGQTSTTYVLVAGDVGYRIRSQVTVTTNAGSSTAYSLPTIAVAPA